MAKIKRSQKIGLPPGTLVHIGEQHAHTPSLFVTTFDARSMASKQAASLADVAAARRSKKTAWIHVDGLHDIKLIEEIGRQFGITSLTLEDVVNTEQRPKLEEHPDYMHLVMKLCTPHTSERKLQREQVSVILTPHAVLTFFEKPTDIFGHLRTQLESRESEVRRRGHDYLFYAILDMLVDNYFSALELLSDELDDLENTVIETAAPSTQTIKRVHSLKRENMLLLKSLWPMREAFGALERMDYRLLKKETRIYLADVYDHVVQLIDGAETTRDTLSNTFEIYMSNQNNRLNETMRVLTVISTIFIPLTFIVGIYGMNFNVMPELHWSWGYYAVLLIMALMAFAMLRSFKKRGWI